MVHFNRTDDLLLDRQMQVQVKVQFERRFGMRFTQFNFDSLSGTERDWVITEAGKEVQKMRGGRK